MKASWLCFVFLECCWSQSCTTENLDFTLIPGANGLDVADAAYEKLDSAFQLQDRGFLMHFAFVESDFGTKTYDYYGNIAQIWPLRRDQFEKTKSTTLSSRHSEIYAKLNINWSIIQYHQLNVPLYSCIAMDLYLHFTNEYPIPYGDEEQGKCYERITGKPSIEWEQIVEDIEENCENNVIDLIFLADESGSIGSSDWVLMTKFMSDLINDLNVGEDTVRVGTRTYSSSTDLRYQLKDYGSDLVTITASLNKNGGGTATGPAIREILEKDFKSNAGMRDASKKVLIVLTDGASNYDQVESASQLLHSDPRNIQSFAIGVGPGPNYAELELIATSEDLIFVLDDFDIFDKIKSLLFTTVCNAPILTGQSNGTITTIVPPAIIKRNSDLLPGKIIMQMTMMGRTIIKVSSNQPVTLFMSYTHNRPTSAIFDLEHELRPSDGEYTFRIRDGTVTFYMAIYNYGGSEATVNVEILESTIIVPDYIIPEPLTCGANAFCDQNVCVCSPGYYPDPSPEDACTFNSCDQSIITCQDHASCQTDSTNSGSCQCNKNYFELPDGRCNHDLCPTEAIKVAQNHLGFGLAVLESPKFPNMTNYPPNYDCNYTVELAKSKGGGGCFNVILEKGISIENSPYCSADRLEIKKILNGALVTMDHVDEHTVVLCGDACIAQDGWIGICEEEKVSVRFQTDESIESTGWTLKFLAKPKSECVSTCLVP